ncbi:MAG: molybdopterin biosynthesis protein [Bacillota bacterium]
MTRRVYLDAIPWEEALERLLTRLGRDWPEHRAETVPVPGASGRVLAGTVLARNSSPHYHACAMDGIALPARHSFGASETTPVTLSRDRAFPVDTGDPLPPGCDAVIMIEDVHQTPDGYEITAPASPWQHVRAVGEDLVATEPVLASGRQLRAEDLGALLAAGITEVAVRRRPVVAIIPTGTELVAPGPGLAPGQIPEFNGPVLAALVESWGGVARRFPPAPDSRELIAQALDEALDAADVVVINAGSSAGSEDYVAGIVKDRGELVCHGVAIRPGKPVILGVARGKPVLGLPGYPVSTYLTATLFLRPLVACLLGVVPPEAARCRARLSRRVVSPMGVEEFVRVKVGRVGDQLVATPIARGAGLIMSLVRADGVIRVTRFSEGLAEGSEVEVELFTPLSQVERTVVLSGSHDLALEILGGLLRGYLLSSSHTGSLAGLLALRRGEAHAAGIHLLDPATGDYNLPYVERALPGLEVSLVTLFHRQQGLLVPKGNPQGIAGFQDLAREEVTLVNRQRGAGTRILLDFHLERAGISPHAVRGYEREEYTHMGVAAAVASGSAACGLGILAAARALNLDFIPVTTERYELAIPAAHRQLPGMIRLLEAALSPTFHHELERLGGYDWSGAGAERRVTP